MKGIKKKILIVDDSELNRSLLSDILSSDFEIIEAENGLEAVRTLQERELEISLVLLDIVMPQMDGFDVLTMMNKKGWIKTIPVIMISAETGGAYIDRAYDLGAIDYISRPFDERTVKHRVACNFMLSLRQKEMSELLSAQIYQKEKDNSLMIEILSHIVEFRNGESGLHVLHVNVITQMLLEQLVKMTDKYKLSNEEIHLISTASALHDIGKISIPSEILNKPGRFTPEEFEIMKGHTIEGAKMLDAIPFRQNEALIKVSYQICRWHHERYDGRGYPDGLVGDEIPISAQAVSMADVYDALTAQRCYKPAFTHEKAVEMIKNGESGVFNPILVDCLLEIAPRLKSELKLLSFGSNSEAKIEDTVKQILKNDKTDVSARTIRLLELERQKFKYLSDISQEITFDYTADPEMIILSERGAKELGQPIRIVEPSKNSEWHGTFPKDDFSHFVSAVRNTTPEETVVSQKYLLTLGGKQKWSKVIAKTLWNDNDPPELEGAIGKIVDVNDETEAMEDLEQKAYHDQKTGLYNHNAAKTKISKMLDDAGNRRYALVFIDLDNFKTANDVYGHLFGDEILVEIATRLKSNIRSTDVAARMGGDEFIVFMRYNDTVIPQIERIFKKLTVKYKHFDIQVSMGVACTEGFRGSYDELLNMADTAMYTVKKGKKNGFCIYDDSMSSLLSAERD